MGNRRANKNGRGSYSNESFVTLSALEQGGDKDGELLNAFMDLNIVTEEERLATKKRDQPNSGPSGQVRIVSGDTVAS